MRWPIFGMVAFLSALLLGAAGTATAEVEDLNPCFGPDSETKIAGCTSILDRDPANVDARLNRASAYIFVRGDYDLAISETRTALRGSLTDYGQGVAYEKLGLAYVGKGEFQSAIVEFDRAYRSYAAPYPLFGRGLAKLRAGNVSEGRADMNAAIAAKPDVAQEWKADWSRLHNPHATIPE
jgi:tetratricopeptide (TPR) repeat protein